jgi:hypothetical protein
MRGPNDAEKLGFVRARCEGKIAVGVESRFEGDGNIEVCF